MYLIFNTVNKIRIKCMTFQFCGVIRSAMVVFVAEVALVMVLLLTTGAAELFVSKVVVVAVAVLTTIVSKPSFT